MPNPDKGKVEAKHLTIHVVNVGHGDSIIVEFPGRNRIGIIDCNRKIDDPRIDTNGGLLKTYSYIKDRIGSGPKLVVEFLCLTHPHADHYSGMAELIKCLIADGVVIKRFWDFGASSIKCEAMLKMSLHSRDIEDAREFERLVAAKNRLREMGCKCEMLVSPREKLIVVRKTTIDLIAPAYSISEGYLNFLSINNLTDRREFLKRFPHVGNDNSICSGLKLSYGKSKILLGADMTNYSWEQVLGKATEEMECNVIKISHHGSLDGNNPFGAGIGGRLRTSAGGRVAAISGGYRTRLPHRETIRDLLQSKIDSYCTGGRSSDLIPFMIDGSHGGKFLRETIGDIWVETESDAITSVVPACGDIQIKCDLMGNVSVATIPT
jgi:beta-lactamase superfamily II metal-dependent hydrolase